MKTYTYTSTLLLCGSSIHVSAGSADTRSLQMLYALYVTSVKTHNPIDAIVCPYMHYIQNSNTSGFNCQSEEVDLLFYLLLINKITSHVKSVNYLKTHLIFLCVAILLGVYVSNCTSSI